MRLFNFVFMCRLFCVYFFKSALSSKCIYIIFFFSLLTILKPGNILHYTTNALIHIKGGYGNMHMDDSKPIYIQISEWLENEILAGSFQVDDKVHSQYSLAEIFTINPATAAKGLNKLADEEVLYNRRGLGKFVSKDAKGIIKNKRKSETLKKLIEDVVMEAERLDVTEDELKTMLKQTKNKREGDAT